MRGLKVFFLGLGSKVYGRGFMQAALVSLRVCLFLGALLRRARNSGIGLGHKEKNGSGFGLLRPSTIDPI